MTVDHLRRGLLAALLGVLASLTAGSIAAAQSYPSRNIRIVVPGGPGTPPDIVTRVVANAITEAEGWQFVIENKPGAIQTLAGSDVFRSPADGYSIFAQAMPIASAPTMLASMPFNLITDFTPVIRLSASYNVLVVTPSLPANSITDLVALIKSQPDKLTFSSGGAGTPAHLTGELFKLQNGLRATHVPYPTNFSNAIADLLNGTNQFMFITTLPVIDLIAAGKLRALAVTAPKRIDALKDVPSVVEQGFPALVVEEWIGWSVRSGTPEDIVSQLNKAANKALTTSKVKEAFAKIGADPVGGTPESYGALVKQQVEYWGKIVKDAGIRPQQ
jgi:tripartite-type tricarboxylate transporter receptor subunit TctC